MKKNGSLIEVDIHFKDIGCSGKEEEQTTSRAISLTGLF